MQSAPNSSGGSSKQAQSVDALKSAIQIERAYQLCIAEIIEIENSSVSFNISFFMQDDGRTRYLLHIDKSEIPIQIELLYWNGHYECIKKFTI